MAKRELGPGFKEYMANKKVGRRYFGGEKGALKDFLISAERGDYIEQAEKKDNEYIGYVVATATYGLKEAAKTKDIQLASLSARALEKLGYADQPGVYKMMMNAWIKKKQERLEDKEVGDMRELERILNKHGTRHAREGLEYSQGEYTRGKRRVGAVAIVLICGAMFFLSGNLTGNVIGSLNQTSSNWIGGVLFVVGLVGAFIYFKRR